MSQPNRTTLIRLVISIVLVLAIFLAFRIPSHGQTLYTLHVDGNSDQIRFRIDPAYYPHDIIVFWGISGQVGQQQSIHLTNGQAIVTPPNNTVSVQMGPWPGSINVVTTFVLLNNEGWYEVPQASHIITVTGSTQLVTFTANYTPILALQVTWGVSGLPAVTQPLTFTNRTVAIVPPIGTVSMLFAPHGAAISTTFANLGAGWYAVPITDRPTPTPTPTRSPNLRPLIYLPLTLQ